MTTQGTRKRRKETALRVYCLVIFNAMPTRGREQILADDNLPRTAVRALLLRVHCGLAAPAARCRNRNHVGSVREELAGVW